MMTRTHAKASTMNAALRMLLPALALAIGALGLWGTTPALAAFGVKSFTTTVTTSQAGAHPDVTVSFQLNTTTNPEGQEASDGTLKDVELQLPPGLIGNPLAAPRCTRAQLDNYASEQSHGVGHSPGELCPVASQVGVIKIEGSAEALTPIESIYNVQPTAGHPADFAFMLGPVATHLVATVRSDGDYGVTVNTTDASALAAVQGITATFWGVPAEPSHDPLRFLPPYGQCFEYFGEQFCEGNGAHVNTTPRPLMTNPTRCSGSAPVATLRVDSWREPERSQEVSALLSPVSGCEKPPFKPTISAQPETSAADSPTGLHVNVHIPQTADPEQLATADLENTVVTFPPGMVVDPSSAGGLGTCSPAQIDLHGSGPANCPSASKLGTVSIDTPLLDHPVPGSIYLGTQGENPFHSLIALYIAAYDPISGVVIKLAGKADPDPVTGQLTATFDESPQLPFEDLDIDLFGGPRAPLTTPTTCGTYTTTFDLTPWTSPAGADAYPSDSFPISAGANGGSCAGSEAQLPNAPGFEAGTTTPLAGTYSPFVLKVSRENGSQRIGAIDTTLPSGLVGRLAGIPYCSPAQIAQANSRSGLGQGAAEQSSPSCPAASEVGTVTVGAGSGAPFYVQGHAYLAGPYKGAPISLEIITPAVAGPFDLGTVAVRTALYVNEATAQIHAVSDPIPSILGGIPLDIRSIALNLSRPQFTLNPTNCEAMAILGATTSTLGQAASLSDRFQVGGCNGLAFKPNLKIRLKGQTRRVGHPALKAVVTAGPGEANIARAQVNLPHGEFLDQGNLNRTCTRPVLIAGNCPKSTIYGKAKAWTPLLEKPLQGHVYLVGGYGYKLPALVADLNGQIRITLVGRVDSGKNKGIRNTFELVPDAPVSRFVLEMKGGKKYGLLENSENLCKASKADRRAIARFTGQNGKVRQFKPVVTNQCGKHGKKHKKKKQTTHARPAALVGHPGTRR